MKNTNHLDKFAEDLKQETSQPPSITRLNPAQDFKNGVAFVTVGIDELDNYEFRAVPYLINSKKEKCSLDKKELASRGIYLDRSPIVQTRWSEQGISEYLSGKAQTDLGIAYMTAKCHFGELLDTGDPRWLDVLALWTLGTYFYRLFPSYPYFFFNGNMESGKSRVLTIISLLAFNGKLNVGSTAASIVRSIHASCNTLCLDETEHLGDTKDESVQALRGVLNTGYKRGALVSKLEPKPNKGGWEERQYDAYSPKTFASIKGMEASLTSRCITLTMVTSGNTVIKNKILNSEDPAWQAARDIFYPVFLENAEKVIAAYNALESTDFFGREWEIWRPILTFAKLIDEKVLYPEIIIFAKKTQEQKKAMLLESSSAPAILQALERALQEREEMELFLSIDEIVESIVSFDEETFSWFKDPMKCRGVSRWVSDQLRKAGVVEGRAWQKKFGDKNKKGFVISLEKVRERLTSLGVGSSVTGLPVVESALVEAENDGNQPVTESNNASITTGLPIKELAEGQLRAW